MKQPQIYFLSGPVHSGKSTRLSQWVLNKKKVDGILAPMIEGRRHLKHIASGEIKCVELPAGKWEQDEVWQIGSYFFSIPVFLWAKKVLLESSRQKPDWLVVDEAGLLELDDRGLEPALTEILKRDAAELPPNIIFVVRENLTERMAEHFGLKEKPRNFTFPE